MRCRTRRRNLRSRPWSNDVRRGEILDAILDELDDAKRAAFILFELEGWPMAEVATAMDCPLQTAYARLYAARRHVEQAVSRRQLGERS